MSRDGKIIHSVKRKYKSSWTETQHISGERLYAELESNHLKKSEEMFHLDLEKQNWPLGGSWSPLGPLYHQPVSEDCWGAPVWLSEPRSINLPPKRQLLETLVLIIPKYARTLRNLWVALGNFMNTQSITNKDRSKIALPGSLAATHLSLTRCQGWLRGSKRTWSWGQKWVQRQRWVAFVWKWMNQI